MKPSIFIACATERLDIARAIQEELDYDAEVVIWTQGVYEPSNYALEDLTKQLGRFDFSLFIFTPDDLVEKRGKQTRAPRDNVIFELGMFIGRIGRERCFIVIPRDQDVATNSDLFGINTLTYESNRSSLVASVGPACNRIRRAISKFGPARLLARTGKRKSTARHSGIAPEERTRLENSLTKIANKQTARPLTLVFIDIDRFGSLNRWYGEEVCNEVLAIIEKITKQICPTAFYTRVGGDEILLCLEKTMVHTAEDIAVKCVTQVRNYEWSLLAPNLYVTLSVGVAGYKEGSPANEWLIRAIHGSIHAKKNGGNCVFTGPTAIRMDQKIRFDRLLS